MKVSLTKHFKGMHRDVEIYTDMDNSGGGDNEFNLRNFICSGSIIPPAYVLKTDIAIVESAVKQLNTAIKQLESVRHSALTRAGIHSEFTKNMHRQFREAGGVCTCGPCISIQRMCSHTECIQQTEVWLYNSCGTCDYCCEYGCAYPNTAETVTTNFIPWSKCITGSCPLNSAE